MIAERARKIGGGTVRSIGDIARHQHIQDTEVEAPTPREMLTALRDDNWRLTQFVRSAHEVCDKYCDVATTSLTEVWIDEAERRAWFLKEIVTDL